MKGKSMAFMSNWTASLLAVFVIFWLTSAHASEDTVTSLDDVISSHDLKRLQAMLSSAEPYEDLATAYQIATTIGALNKEKELPSEMANACSFARSQPLETLEDIFYAASVSNAHKKTCPLSLSKEVTKMVTDAVAGEPSMEALYYAVSAMAYTGMKIDNETIPLLLSTAQREETPLAFGQAFLAGAAIPGSVDLSELFSQIGDIVAQADETPTTLYYEGGLAVTSTIINGIFALASRGKDNPEITEAQAIKFGNYLVSNKYTASLNNAHLMLTAAASLATNKFVVPSALLLANNLPISKSSQNLEVQLSNILGRGVDSFTVKVASIEGPSGAKHTIKKPMTMAADKLTYSYPLFPDVTEFGVHKVTLSAVPKKSSAVVGLPNVELSVTVSYRVTVANAQLSTVEKDQGVTTKLISLEYPNTSKASIEADQHAKLVMTFNLLNMENSEIVTAHQTFVRLSKGLQEIFFVATANDDGLYSFELDVMESASDFGQQSGTYTLTLVVGDFALENPFSWEVGSVVLKFPGTYTETEPSNTYKAKPLVEHLFRSPEPRPPKTVSSTFTILVLVPLGLLVLMWLILGVNISNLTTGGIWTILFHIGLGAIFGLYYCFWLQLNMFQTLKYLAGLGLFTYITGNRMLRRIAKARLA